MSGPAALLATLGALYLLECIVAVPGRHVAFRGTALASWRRVRAGLQVGTQGRRIAFLPLAPWARGLLLAGDDGGSLDADAARERLSTWTRATGALRVDAVAMFALIFVLGPLAVRLVGWNASWPIVLIGVLAVALLTVGDFRRAWAALHPDSPRAPLGVLLTIALSPASAMRAPDVLLRDLLGRFHPLAVALVVCMPDAYERVASAWIRSRRRIDARARRHGASRDGDDAERSRRASVEAFITRTVRDPERLDAPPERRDPDARSYCPSCLDQFVIERGTCEDCDGVELVSFEVAADGAAGASRRRVESTSPVGGGADRGHPAVSGQP